MVVLDWGVDDRLRLSHGIIRRVERVFLSHCHSAERFSPKLTPPKEPRPYLYYCSNKSFSWETYPPSRSDRPTPLASLEHSLASYPPSTALPLPASRAAPVSLLSRYPWFPHPTPLPSPLHHLHRSPDLPAKSHRRRPPVTLVHASPANRTVRPLGSSPSHVGNGLPLQISDLVSIKLSLLPVTLPPFLLHEFPKTVTAPTPLPLLTKPAS